jgi:hypothetical protein
MRLHMSEQRQDARTGVSVRALKLFWSGKCGSTSVNAVKQAVAYAIPVGTLVGGGVGRWISFEGNHGSIGLRPKARPSIGQARFMHVMPNSSPLGESHDQMTAILPRRASASK